MISLVLFYNIFGTADSQLAYTTKFKIGESEKDDSDYTLSENYDGESY